MKKLISILLTLVLAASLLVGCGAGQAPAADTEADGKVKIVATIFPAYDWIRAIVGENNPDVQLTLLMKNGTDLHSFQPSTKDMVDISQADVFVYVGGHSDTWVEDALKNAANPDRVVVNLFDVLADTLKPLKMTEGMEHVSDDPDHEHHHEDEADEHVWLSLPRAKTSVLAIADAIAQADPDHAADYQANAESYTAQLDTLDEEYRQAAASGRTDTLVFTDRFPFFYMVDDYGLNCYAAFTGCSSESEASFETVMLLAQKIDELDLHNVITIENRSHQIPETVIESTKTKDQNILEMNSLQSVSETQIQEGLTYLGVMQSNLDVLKTALQ